MKFVLQMRSKTKTVQLYWQMPSLDILQYKECRISYSASFPEIVQSSAGFNRICNGLHRSESVICHKSYGHNDNNDDNLHFLQPINDGTNKFSKKKIIRLSLNYGVKHSHFFFLSHSSGQHNISS